MSTLPPIVKDEGHAHKYFAAIPNTVIKGKRSKELSVYAKWLYVYLKSVTGDTGTCKQGERTLADVTGMSRSEVQRAKRELLEAALIVVSPGPNPRRNPERIQLTDIWPENMLEYQTPGEWPSQGHIESEQNGRETAEVALPGPGWPYQGLGGPVAVHRKNLLRKTSEEEERETLPSVESVGNVNGVHAANPPVASSASALPPTQRKKTPTPLDPHDWLWQELQHYEEEFDLEVFNDDGWWSNVANSFSTPPFAQSWVAAAFADLAQWLQTNPGRRPRTARGWKQRMSYSLKRYYEIHLRRESYGKAQKPTQRYR